jgi:transposase
MSMATRKPATYYCPATRWSLDDLVTALLQRPTWTMSRSSIWRILEEADLKPHRSVYWLNSHDPDFEAKAHDICSLYLNAPRFFEQGRLVICCDEKTGMQMLERKHPTQPMAPGKPEKREHEYIHHGTRALLASFVVPTGQVLWNLGKTRTSADFVAHLSHVVAQLPEMKRYDWVVDNFTPKHGSWLNQVELWFSVLARRFLKRGDFSGPQDFAARLCDYLEVYTTHQAHPYRWTYTGQPLVRATPFSQTRRQQRQGRAWFSPRSQRFARAFYPPRPYKRVAA